MLLSSRVASVGDQPMNPNGDYVLYWMIATRRAQSNYALDHALALARSLRRPLLVLEPLRIGYRWASPRIHRFVVEGMADQRQAFARSGVRYWPYVEPRDGDGRGLLVALAQRACVVVTDWFPAFFHPRMVAAAGAKLPVRLEQVDSNGLLPLSASAKAYPTAAAFRRHLQAVLPPYLSAFPGSDPLADYTLGSAPVPDEVARRWPAADPFLDDPGTVTRLGLAGPGFVSLRGGSTEGRRQLERFIADGLGRYDQRSHPDAQAVSGLSPWLHFGHLSIHEVVGALFSATGWSADKLGKPTGAREGYWGLPAPAEKFMDEIVTWREVGHVFCERRPEYDQFHTLPPWAKATLAAHRSDPRPVLYTLDQLAAAGTADPVWNAAQRQLVGEGRIHNTLRMLWGKRVLTWTASPEEAWGVLIELNNRFGIDGRDPNSYTGIGWVFGRFDRPWPERPIFGMVRTMTSGSTSRKITLRRYLTQWGESPPLIVR